MKAPKVYWTDVGLARVLGGGAGIAEGAIYETFVLGEILKWRSFQSEPPEIYFYRTHAGAEVDFLLTGVSKVIGIEVKASERVSASDGRVLAAVLSDREAHFPAEPKSRIGLVVYRGRDVAELRPRVWAVPDWIPFAPSTSSRSMR